MKCEILPGYTLRVKGALRSAGDVVELDDFDAKRLCASGHVAEVAGKRRAKAEQAASEPAASEPAADEPDLTIGDEAQG